MKKVLSFVLALSLVFALVACGETKDDPAVKSEGVMTYQQYADAALDAEVTIEAYVQAKQGWWEKDGVGVATIYTQDTEGAYFIYEMPISKEDYDKLTKGAKIRVKGYKAEFHGEVEIIDATYEILEGNYAPEAVDLTNVFGTDDLIKKQNMFFTVKNAVVAASTDADGNEVAFLYNWDGSGQDGSDLYFNVKIGEATYNFTVESYLCGKDTDVYKAVKALNIGDTINLEGFLYWYDGVNPHITAVSAAN